MENRERFLPIGSVVVLQGGTKKVMITGFCSVAAEDKTKIYDYTGCVYPEGYLNSNQVCLFDHSQIEQIFFVGYEDEEENEFKKSLDTIIEEYENGGIEFTDEDFDEADSDEGLDEVSDEDDSDEDIEEDSDEDLDEELEDEEEDLEYL